MKKYPSRQMYVAIMNKPLYGPGSLAVDVMVYEKMMEQFDEEVESERPTIRVPE